MLVCKQIPRKNVQLVNRHSENAALETYIEDLIDYCIMQNWYDTSKETDKAMACLRASLSPAARTVYKYSLGLSDADLKKPYSVVSALREYYGASVGVSGERQKFLRLLQQENEPIASWETKIRNQAAQCEYQDFADELMRDQFIAGLTSDALRVKLIGKGHRHKTTQENVKLREVVEVAKAFEATTFANQLMKAARNTQQEQINYTTKSPPPSQCFWCGGKHQQPRQQHCPACPLSCGLCARYVCERPQEPMKSHTIPIRPWSKIVDHLSAPDAKLEYEVFRLEIAEMDIEPNRITSETMQQIKQETAKDSVLASLCDVVASGWPAERKETPEHLRQYWSFRDEISVYDGVAYRSHQVIVPSSLREEMLQKIHKAHQGVDSSIRRARESLFWPGMQAAIKEKCLSCGLCARYVCERPQEPMQSHTIPIRPWSKISADLFHLDGNNYLVMVDHYSDYIELDSLSGNTSANTVIKAMKGQFARHGTPDELVTDNGPQFESHEYSRFAREYGFTIVKSSPYYSRGNGKAESAVKIAKNILQKSRKEDPYLALLAYRNTPQQGYNYSPAQRLMSRRLKDIIPTTHHQLTPQAASPSLVHGDIAERRRRSMVQYKKRASQPLREFSKGEKVFVKPRPGNKHQPWIYGEVIGSTAPRSCTVNTSAGPVRRNHTQIREAKAEPEEKLEDRLETVSLPESELTETDQPVEQEPTPQSGQEPVSTLRRSMRQRRPPSRFRDFVMN